MKQYVYIAHAFRDSFEHKNDDFVLGNTITIKNPWISFNLEIPASYIEGFNKEHISPKRNDKYIEKETKKIVNGFYDTIKYYRTRKDILCDISPSNLEFLLNYFNNDINQIRKLPKSFCDMDLECIKLLLDNYTIDEICTLPTSVFSSKIEKLAQMMLHKEEDITILSKLPDNAFKDFERTKIIIEHLIQNNINIDDTRIYKLFINVDTTLKLIRELELNNLSISKLLDINEVIFFNNEMLKHLIKIFEDNEIDKKYVYLNTNMILYDPNDIEEIIKFFRSKNVREDLFEYLFNRNDILDINRIKMVVEYALNNHIELKDAFSLTTAIFKIENSLGLVDKLIRKGFSIEDINELPIIAFANPETTIKLYGLLNKNELCLIPNICFIDYQKGEKIINWYKEHNIDLELSSSINYCDNIDSQLNVMTNTIKYGFNFIKTLHDYAFENEENTMEILELLKMYNIKPSQIKSGSVAAYLFSMNINDVREYLSFISENELDDFLTLPFSRFSTQNLYRLNKDESQKIYTEEIKKYISMSKLYQISKDGNINFHNLYTILKAMEKVYAKNNPRRKKLKIGIPKIGKIKIGETKICEIKNGEIKICEIKNGEFKIVKYKIRKINK